MGKPADTSVGFVYPTGGSDSDIGVYKQPETITVPNTTNGPLLTQDIKISAGNVTKGAYGAVNPFGTKEMRGYGAATKGRKISGKQG